MFSENSRPFPNERIHPISGEEFRSIADGWQIYHFHDTGRLSEVRMPCDITDNKYLKYNASNLAAFLYALKTGIYQAKTKLSLNERHVILPELEVNKKAQDSYHFIVEAVKSIAPFFEDFVLNPPPEGSGNDIRLQWKQKNSDLDMQSFHLSDGTLRFICMAAAILQPQPPEMIIIDEPELGLHPEALEILAELIHTASAHTCFILSTQSPAFADLFAPEEIATVKRIDGATVLERLDADK